MTKQVPQSQPEQKFIQQEKKLEKIHYRIIMGLILFTVVYHYFIEPQTIGHDVRYSIFIFGIPTVFGVLVLGIYRRKFLINKFSTNKSLVLWIFMFFFYLIQGVLFSYLSFGQLANVSWNIINKKVAEGNQLEIFDCPVTKFLNGRKMNTVYFRFKDRSESIQVDYKTINQYEDKDPRNYKITIEVQKGVWNYYLINNWTVQEK